MVFCSVWLHHFSSNVDFHLIYRFDDNMKSIYKRVVPCDIKYCSYVVWLGNFDFCMKMYSMYVCSRVGH